MPRLRPAFLLLLFLFLAAPSWSDDTTAAEVAAAPEANPLAARYTAELLELVRWNDFRARPREERPEVAVVLGGGGARGLAHLGVLSVLESERIPIDQVAGVSVGGFVGSLYCVTGRAAPAVEVARKTQWANLVEVGYSPSGFFTTRRLERYLDHALETLYLKSHDTIPPGGIFFEHLAVPFRTGATDLLSGEPVLFETGPVAPAVRASASIPGLFSPYEYDGRTFVDGGVGTSLPIVWIRPAERPVRILAVDVQGDLPPESPRGLWSLLAQIIWIQGQRLATYERDRAPFLIRPAVGEIFLMDLSQGEEAIREGRRAARAALPAIRRYLMGDTTRIVVTLSPDSGVTLETGVAARFQAALGAERFDLARRILTTTPEGRDASPATRARWEARLASAEGDTAGEIGFYFQAWNAESPRSPSLAFDLLRALEHSGERGRARDFAGQLESDLSQDSSPEAAAVRRAARVYLSATRPPE